MISYYIDAKHWLVLLDGIEFGAFFELMEVFVERLTLEEECSEEIAILGLNRVLSKLYSPNRPKEIIMKISFEMGN